MPLSVSLWWSKSEQREHDRAHEQSNPQEYPGQLDLGKMRILDVNFVGLALVVNSDLGLHFTKYHTQ